MGFWDAKVNVEGAGKQFVRESTDTFLRAEHYGEGHINDTFAAYYRRADGSEYRNIMQRINNEAFKDPIGLMNNISGVTEFLREIIRKRGGDTERETMTVIPAQDGKNYYLDENGCYWRSYIFVEQTLSLQTIENDQDFYNCGTSFGNFQRLLADYPAAELTEPIPHFHDTKDRFRLLKEAVEADKFGRAASVQKEIDFAFAREKDAAEIVDQIEAGIIPLRVTHNDTKLNNILIDEATGDGICVIDLDTIMPGAACYDFGDSIRFGANTAAEDEKDLSKVTMSLHLFEVFAKGYLSVAKDFLTPAEAKSLAIGAKLMTYECGIRFLTDYLNGDVYFKVHYEGHNLDRCHTQFKLVEDMEQKMPEMQAIVAKYMA